MTVMNTLSPPTPFTVYSFPTRYGGYDQRTGLTTFVAETRPISYTRPLLGTLLSGSSRGEVRFLAYTACQGQASDLNQCPTSNVRVEFRHYNTSDTQCTYVVGQKVPVTITVRHGGRMSRAVYPSLDYKLQTSNNASEVSETIRPECELAEVYAWVMNRDEFFVFTEAEMARVSFGGFDYELTGHNSQLMTFNSK
jgi:hypothetical protein